MDTACYQYNLGSTIDIKKLEKLPQLTRINKLDLLEAKFGNLVIHIFQSGEIRAFVPGGKVDALQSVLLAAGVKIIELLQGIKKLGYSFDEQKVLSEGHPMLFEYLAPVGVRPSFKGVSIDLLREVAFAPYDVSQEFQLERNFVQGGENAGRRIVASIQPKNVKDVNKALVGFFKDSGIGVASFTEEKNEKSTYPAQVLRLNESAFAVGMPVINKTYCHFVRGLLRGAYVAFYELENISVMEENCWGLGDTYCQFRAVVFPK